MHKWFYWGYKRALGEMKFEECYFLFKISPLPNFYRIGSKFLSIHTITLILILFSRISNQSQIKNWETEQQKSFSAKKMNLSPSSNFGKKKTGKESFDAKLFGLGWLIKDFEDSAENWNFYTCRRFQLSWNEIAQIEIKNHFTIHRNKKFCFRLMFLKS